METRNRRVLHFLEPAMKSNEPRFGAAIPQDQWIQRTVTTDPNPRMPFSGIYYQDEIKMPFFEHMIAGAVFGFAVGAILFS